MTQDAETPYFANAHIHKSYVLKQPDAVAAVDADAADDSDLAALFARVDADGDGRIAKEEATLYVRSKGIELDEYTLDTIWETVDANGDGSLDMAEFPALLDAIKRKEAKMTRRPAVGTS